MNRKITSQLTRIENIIEEKRASKDYEVQFVTLEIDGEMIDYIIDGHHSYDAAKADGVQPDFIDVTDRYAKEIEYVGGSQKWLDDNSNGEGWWELETGRPAW